MKKKKNVVIKLAIGVVRLIDFMHEKRTYHKWVLIVFKLIGPSFQLEFSIIFLSFLHKISIQPKSKISISASDFRN